MCCSGPVNTLAWTEASKPAWNLPPVQLTCVAFLLLGFSPHLLCGETLLCSGQASSASPPSSVPEGVPKSSFTGRQPHVTASMSSFVAASQRHGVLLPSPRTCRQSQESGSKRVDGKHPHTSFLYLTSLVWLKFFLIHSAVRGTLYLSTDEVKDRSHIPEMQKLQCRSSALGVKTKDWGVDGGDPHTTDSIFLFCSIKSCIRTDFSKERFPTLFPVNFPLVSLQVVCTSPVIQLPISSRIVSLIVALVSLSFSFFFFKAACTSSINNNFRSFYHA